MWQHSLIILLAILCSSQVATALDFNTLCRGLRVGDVLPHPTDCQTYIVCSSNKIDLHHCDNGLHFDDERKVCNWPERANCKVQETPTTDKTNHTTAPPEIATETSTDVIETTTTATISTTSSSSSSSSTMPTPTPTDTDDDDTNMHFAFAAYNALTGQLIDPMEGYNAAHVQCLHLGAYMLPHPTDCQQYVLCAFGHLLLHQCGRGSVWNYRQQQCEVNSQSVCYAIADEAASATATTTKVAESVAATHSLCYAVYSSINGQEVLTWQPLVGSINATTTATTSSITTTATQSTWAGYTPTPFEYSSTTATTKTNAPTTTKTTTTIKNTPTTTTNTIRNTPTSSAATTAPQRCSDGVKYLADFDDCTHYFICIQMISVGMYCPAGSYWDHVGEFCTAKARAQCAIRIL